jgi:hypothetical protein
VERRFIVREDRAAMTTATRPYEAPDRSGGADGNGLLIAMTAVVLIWLLAALGVTIVHMGGLVLRRHTISSGDRVDLRARLARASTSSCEPAGTPRDKRTLA